MQLKKKIGLFKSKIGNVTEDLGDSYKYNVKPKAKLQYAEAKKTVADVTTKASKASKKVGDYAEKVNRNTKTNPLLNPYGFTPQKRKKSSKKTSRGQTVIIINNSSGRKKKKRRSSRQGFSLI